MKRTFNVLISDHAREDMLLGRPNVIGAFIANPERFDAHRAVAVTITVKLPKPTSRRQPKRARLGAVAKRS